MRVCRGIWLGLIGGAVGGMRRGRVASGVWREYRGCLEGNGELVEDLDVFKRLDVPWDVETILDLRPG